MRLRPSSILVAFASAAALASIVACGDAPASSTLGHSEKDTSANEKAPAKDAKAPAAKDSPTSNSATPSSPTSSAGTPTTPAAQTPVQGTGVCAGKADSTACFTCCEGISPDAKAAADKEKALDDRYKACACAAAKCATECATDYCKADADAADDATAGSACEKCLTDKATDCDTQVQPERDALEQTPGWIALDKCEADAKCQAMEDAEGD